MKERNFITGILKLRLTEIIIFAIYFLLGFFAIIKQPSFLMSALLLGSLGYVFFIVEHKIQIVLNKLDNTVIFKEKALFLPLEKIKFVEFFSNLSDANVVRKFGQNYNTSSNTCKLVINCKNGKTLYPFGNIYTNNSTKYTKICNDINSFLVNDTPILTIKESPFFLRFIIGVPFSFIYIICCLSLISPEAITPLIQMISPLLEAIGIYQIR